MGFWVFSKCDNYTVSNATKETQSTEADKGMLQMKAVRCWKQTLNFLTACLHHCYKTPGSLPAKTYISFHKRQQTEIIVFLATATNSTSEISQLRMQDASTKPVIATRSLRCSQRNTNCCISTIKTNIFARTCVSALA